MKLEPIASILARANRLQTLALQAQFLCGHIASEQRGNIYRTSVRIRELQAAAKDVQRRRLKRERTAA